MSQPLPPNCMKDTDSHVFMTYTIDRDGNSGSSGSLTTYVFSPTPLIEVQRNVIFSGKEQIGTDIVLNFSGNLVAPKFINENCGNGDLADIDQDVAVKSNLDELQTSPTLQTGYMNITILNALMRKMSQVLSVPGGKFELYEICKNDQGGEDRRTFFRCYPQAVSDLKFGQSPDNWTTTIPYTFSMTVSRTDIYAKDTDKNGNAKHMPLYLESISEEWSIQPLNEGNGFENILIPSSAFGDLLEAHNNRDYEAVAAIINAAYMQGITETQTRLFTITHTLSATGKTVYGLQTDIPQNASEPSYRSSQGIDTFFDHNHNGFYHQDNQNIHQWKQAEQQSIADQQ